MPGSWSLACCVLLTSLSVCCAVYPQQQQQRQQRIKKHHDTQDSAQSQIPPTDGLTERKEALGQDRVKRKTAECHVLETEERSGLQKIVDASGETQKFFIQPQPGFNRFVFRMKVNSKFDISSWKYAKEILDISSSRLNTDWTHPTWIPVEVEYFKNEVSFGKDRHALRVKVGDNVNEILITRWWRTHSYEGFAIYAEGPLKVLFKCNPQNAMAESIIYKEERPVLLILSVLGACFLLVVGAAIVCLLNARCSRTQRDNSPSVPRFPKSLLLERHINRENDSDPIYETIDEATLTKLRQNLDSETLGRPQGVRDHCGPSAKRFRENTKTLCDMTFRGECHSSGIPAGDAGGPPGLSLLEEKAALRQHSGLDSPLESHYVEMHGIVSRTSSLNK